MEEIGDRETELIEARRVRDLSVVDGLIRTAVKSASWGLPHYVNDALSLARKLGMVVPVNEEYRLMGEAYNQRMVALDMFIRAGDNSDLGKDSLIGYQGQAWREEYSQAMEMKSLYEELQREPRI